MPLNAEANESRKEQRAKDKAFGAALGSALGNFVTVDSGQVKPGEQIPILKFADGTEAKRKDTHYMVSPAEMPTSITYTATGGAFVIKCFVDESGKVTAELWQQSGTGKGVPVIAGNMTEQIRNQIDSVGYSLTGNENVVAQQMEVFTQNMLVNYMAIAVRSAEK